MRDRKLLVGFSALLLLIIGIGIIGISQILSLGETVDSLVKNYFPMQKAVVEMRINNSLYAKGIRSYLFWKTAKYLEAVRLAGDLDIIERSILEFDRQLDIYSSYAKLYLLITPNQWIERISTSEKELRSIGSRIVTSIDQNLNIETINNLLMAFESRLFKIDEFLDGVVHSATLKEINSELKKADLRKNRALLLLRLSLIFSIALGTEIAVLVYRSLKHERARREELMHHMIRIEEEERRNLSQEVHDQMGQDLSALKIYLDLMDQKLQGEKEDVQKDIVQTKKLLSQLIEKSHNISELLRPPALDEIGLVDTIEALLLQFKQITNIHFIYKRPRSEIKLSSENSLTLYRVIQEGLTNIVKHSKAKNVEISIEERNGRVLLSINDDGVGLDYEEHLKQPRRRKDDKLKLGIIGLKERLELLDGKMNILSAPGKGTHLIVELPL